MRSPLTLLAFVALAIAAPPRPYPSTIPYISMPSNPTPPSPYRHRPSSRPSPYRQYNNTHTFHPRQAPPDPIQQLLSIAPTSNTCANVLYPTECTTTSPAVVQAILASFTKYNINTAPEQAAILSWMAFESDDFKYNHNHFPAPGNPGQGTRCMMSPSYVAKYADGFPELQSGIVAARGNPDKILALVQPDEYSFAAAAWYYATMCGADSKAKVRAGGQANWKSAFVQGCVGTTVTDARVDYWKRACQALSVPVTP